MKRSLTVLSALLISALLASWGLSQVPASFLRSGILTAQSGAPGGGVTLLEQHSASSSSELDFTTCFSSTYNSYFVTAENVLPASNAQPLTLQFGTGAGPSYDTTSNYEWGYNYVLLFASSGGSYSSAGTDTSLQLGIAQVDSTAVWNGVNGSFLVNNPNSGGYVYVSSGPWGAKDARDAGPNMQTGGGLWKGAAAATAFRVKFPSGNIVSGTLRCYGYSK